MFNLNEYKNIMRETKKVNLEEYLVGSELVEEVDSLIKEDLRNGKEEIIIPLLVITTESSRDEVLKDYSTSIIAETLCKVMVSFELPAYITDSGNIKIDFREEYGVPDIVVVEDDEELISQTKEYEYIKSLVDLLELRRHNRNQVFSLSNLDNYRIKEIELSCESFINQGLLKTYEINASGFTLSLD